MDFVIYTLLVLHTAVLTILWAMQREYNIAMESAVGLKVP